MRKFFWLLVFILLSVSLAAVDRTWIGGTSSNWNTPNNWSPYGVPLSGENLTIQTGTYQPVVSAATANCGDLNMLAGTTLGISSTYSLNASGNVTIRGALTMSNSGQFTCSGYFTWMSGATASVTNSSAQINCFGNMTFASGSLVQMSNGTVMFRGTDLYSYLINNSSLTKFNHLVVNKAPGTIFQIDSTCTQPFTVQGDITNYSGNTFNNNYAGTVNLLGSIYDLTPFSSSQGISWGSGTLNMDGSGAATISLQGGISKLNNLTCSKTGTISTLYALTLQGDLLIESGAFNPNNLDIIIQGDWSNMVGATAFVEDTGEVIFNGIGHQYVNHTETFNLLTIDKLTGALRVNSSTAVVTCAGLTFWDGAVDVLSGTFTANDITRDWISQDWYVNPGGTINITNTDGTVSLRTCSLTFTGGGTINIYGGTGTAELADGSVGTTITMNGGTLDFHDVGIKYQNSYADLTLNMSGGTIRTSGGFSCMRSDFTMSGGTLEFYGSTDATLAVSYSPDFNSINNLLVNKVSATLTVSHDLLCNGNITVNSGTLKPSGINLTCQGNLTNYGNLNLYLSELTCGSDLLNYGILTLNSLNCKLVVLDDVFWYNGSSSVISQGEIECGGHWYMYPGAAVSLSGPNILTLKSTSARTIYVGNTGAQFSNLVIGSAAAGSGYSINNSSTQNLLVVGNMTITANNSFNLNVRDVTVNGSLNLNGSLYTNTRSFSVHGKPYFAATSLLNIDGGMFYCDESTVLPRTTNLYGTLTMNSGYLTLVNHSLTVRSGSVNTLTNPTIYCDGIIAQSANTFQPIGGSVYLETLFGGGSFSLDMDATNWLPSVHIDCTTTGYTLAQNITVKGSLYLDSGNLDATTSNRNITLNRNWYNNGGTFTERAGKVTFNGSVQSINGNETFYTLELNGGTLTLNASVTCARYDWVAGSIVVAAGTFTANDIVDSGLFGGFDVHDDCAMNLTNNDGRIDLNCTLTLGTYSTVNIYGGTAMAYWPYAGNAILNMGHGSELTYWDQGVYIYNSPTYSFSFNSVGLGGDVAMAGNFVCNRGDFVPDQGTFQFIGSANTSINFSVPGSQFYMLQINKSSSSSTVSLNSNIVLASTMRISSGTLNSNSRTIDIYGGWQKLPAATFIEGTSQVNFLGGYALIYEDANFYSVTVNKSSDGLNTHNFVDVTILGTLLIQSGYFAQNYTNTLSCGNMTINEGAQFLGSNLTLSGNLNDQNISLVGIENVFLTLNGAGTQNIQRASGNLSLTNLTIDKAAGSVALFYNPLDIAGSVNLASGTWQDNGSYRTHYVGGNFAIGANGVFLTNTQSTVVFDGSDRADISSANYDTGLCNVTIAKGVTEGTYIASDFRLLDGGSLTLNSGNLNLNGYEFNCAGNIALNGGTFNIYGGTILRLGNNMSLNVFTGAILNLNGIPTNPILISSISGYYNFAVESGGRLLATYADFEYMGTGGITMKDGSLGSGHNTFAHCAFRDGAPGGVLLTINNAENYTFEGVNFPVNTWGSANNVRKTVNQGEVTFQNSLGGFNGSAYENDLYSRLHWTNVGTVDLQVIDTEVSSLTPYVGDTVGMTVYLYNGGILDISSPVWLDLYYDQSAPPEAGETGNQTMQITSLPPGTVIWVEFEVPWYAVANWNTWLQIDSWGNVTEVNEENNVLGPIPISWQALPTIQDLEISLYGTANVRLDWTYPIPVTRFKVYRSLDPMFEPGPATFFAYTENPWMLLNRYDRYFYLTTAERLEP